MGALRGPLSSILGHGGQIILPGKSDVLKCERDFFMKRRSRKMAEVRGMTKNILDKEGTKAHR